MKTVLVKDLLGITLNLENVHGKEDHPPLSARLIINHLQIDDDGNICLGAPVGFRGALDVIDALKSELECLANETVIWFAQNIALQKPHLSLVSSALSSHEEKAQKYDGLSCSPQLTVV